MTRRDPLGNEVFLIALSFPFLNRNLADVSFCVTALFPNLRFVVVREKKFIFQFNILDFLNTYFIFYLGCSDHL